MSKVTFGFSTSYQHSLSLYCLNRFLFHSILWSFTKGTLCVVVVHQRLIMLKSSLRYKLSNISTNADIPIRITKPIIHIRAPQTTITTIVEVTPSKPKKNNSQAYALLIPI